MSLVTPESIRRLQRKLYLKAKAEPAFRFYVLYDKIWREDILAHAWALAKANGGAAGVDGMTFAEIEAAGMQEWLAGLREELRSRTYRPQPVRRTMIPKPGGGERPLGIPTIRDRVTQTAAKLVVEPIFEADLDESAYGYRPRRGGADAIKEVHRLIRRGYTDVVDADLSKYFDTIPHRDLLQCVARRIVDRHVLRLIKLWLKAPVEERDGDGRRRMTGGKSSTCGTPQGGVISLSLLKTLSAAEILAFWASYSRSVKSVRVRSSVDGCSVCNSGWNIWKAQRDLRSSSGAARFRVETVGNSRSTVTSPRAGAPRGVFHARIFTG